MTAQSLPEAAHEHHERLLERVNAIPAMADALLGAKPDEALASIATMREFLTGTLLPHMEAAERALYPQLERLFQPINYTLSPVGLALDALAQRFLDGNSVAYQLFSMVIVLGALLWLQWRLLLRALADRGLAALCFSLALLMVQPGSYCGLEHLAYPHALPLV